mmetsp:Transcript_64640/g.117971  ORF Transcript_64640/g.117971 Transcript_64640/m.117971 type:complete len:100 (+) Transcript_64640:494-793(+)
MPKIQSWSLQHPAHDDQDSDYGSALLCCSVLFLPHDETPKYGTFTYNGTPSQRKYESISARDKPVAFSNTEAGTEPTAPDSFCNKIFSCYRCFASTAPA